MGLNLDRKVLILVLLAFLLGAFLRLFKLSSYPVSLTMDEVAVSYNSYSILKTGEDEFGTPFPLAFRSVGDYKPPLLVYTMVPAMAIFGLTEFGTRITIALVGILTILAVFFLVRRLTNNQWIAALASFSVAISPWHIKFSRSTFEAILALFLVLLGALFFLRAAQQKGRLLWLSAIFFTLSLYAYHAERVFVPLFVLGMAFIYRKELFAARKETIKALIVGFILVLPLIFVLLSPAGRTRASMTIFTKDYELQLLLAESNNYALTTFGFWAKRYLDYFDLNFLFVDGMEFTMDKAPDLGLLYLFELPLFAIGLFVIFVKRRFLELRERQLVLLWFLLGPLAASLANNAFHPLRFLIAVPVPHLFSAVGFFVLWEKIKDLRLKKIFLGVSFSAVVVSLLYFVNLYFLHYQLIFSEFMMDGWKDAAKYALFQKDKYQEVVIDPRFGTQGPYTVGTPYLYVLYYGKVDPEEFQNDPRRQEFYSSSNFDNFTFREIKWAHEEDPDSAKKGVLFIGSPWVLPAHEKEVLQKFHLINGKEIIRAATPN